MKKIALFIVLSLICKFADAQILQPVKWSYAAKRINAKEAIIYLKATIDNGWHIYSQKIADGGPTKTEFNFYPSSSYALSGKTLEPKAIVHYDKMFQMNVGHFEKSVVFQQKILLKSKGKVTVKGKLGYGVCNDEKCLPPDEVEFNINV
ncbi:protein-disulfide reductase DsbD domain-containing protein [Pedobacter frigoris]|uniref:protein-disulfide reductase DsbD domain-containing protein n=1 Tax=Pedobacter frigoris TaxID=2571272 RepID=UPI00292D37ED|nr:protein-disulfide reductase DsbD domain-containing protein [Pedobacter frigoris]